MTIRMHVVNKMHIVTKISKYTDKSHKQLAVESRPTLDSKYKTSLVVKKRKLVF